MDVGGMGVGAAAGGVAKRRTGTVHRQIDNSMHEERGGAETPKRRRKREREQMLQGFEYGPALTVSNANFELAEVVFDMLDKDKNGSLDSTDFVNAGVVDREIFHRACRPVPRGGIEFHEFLRRCAKFACGTIQPNGAVLYPASKGPQTLAMQTIPIVKMLELAETRMNEELHQFFSEWQRSLEATSGVAVAIIQVAAENMVMMCRIYNRLDTSYGDGDGMLSAADGCWPILQQHGFVTPAQTALTFDQFREAIVTRAIDHSPFVLDRASFTMDIAVPYVTQKLNEAILALLVAPGTGLASNITDCPSVTEIAQGMCPELDHPPLQAPQPLSTHALSLTLDETMLMDLTLLYKDLDEDESGSLEAEDFQNGAAMEQLWEQLRTLDIDGDGQISMDEFIRGFAMYSLQRAAEFPLDQFQRDCTLRTFITGIPCRDPSFHHLYPCFA
jgi:Ca2+-binding EF-hand superfamily protein